MHTDSCGMFLVQVLIHESGESYYIVELNGDMIEQGNDSEKLWNALGRAPETDFAVAVHRSVRRSQVFSPIRFPPSPMWPSRMKSM
jgi:hypothetical protein